MSTSAKPLQSLLDDALQVLLGIHCKLSHENLSADGEIPLSTQRSEYRRLMDHLEAFATKHGLSDDAFDKVLVFSEVDVRIRARNTKIKAAESA
jgi:hypothetical protein